MLSVVHHASDRSSCVKNEDRSSGGSDSQLFQLFSHLLPTWEMSGIVALSVTIVMLEQCVREGATDARQFDKSACWRLELLLTFFGGMNENLTILLNILSYEIFSPQSSFF